MNCFWFFFAKKNQKQFISIKNLFPKSVRALNL
jgi:hypothetical protein